MLRKIEARKAFDTARRVLGICSLIFRYGVDPQPIKRSRRDCVWPLSSIEKFVSDTIADGRTQ
jgi:hypothetical protein